jgi:Winged helix-turn helix
LGEPTSTGKRRRSAHSGRRDNSAHNFTAAITQSTASHSADVEKALTEGLAFRRKFMRMVPPLRITGEERKELERRARGDQVSRRAAQRAQIVLLAAEGVANREIARLVGLNQNQVGMWRKRYAALGMIGLEDRPRPGRPRRDTKAA